MLSVSTWTISLDVRRLASLPKALGKPLRVTEGEIKSTERKWRKGRKAQEKVNGQITAQKLNFGKSRCQKNKCKKSILSRSSKTCLSRKSPNEQKELQWRIPAGAVGQDVIARVITQALCISRLVYWRERLVTRFPCPRINGGEWALESESMCLPWVFHSPLGLWPVLSPPRSILSCIKMQW